MPSSPRISTEQIPSRTLSESALLTDNPPFLNHATLYFEDGNLIIMPNDSTTLFCVHRSLLSAHSVVLREMCARDQKAHEWFRGCPLIRMPDALDDLQTLFDMIYDGL